MNRLTAISLFAAGSLALAAVGCSDAPLSATTDPSNQTENVFGAGKLLPTPADAEVVEDSYIVVFHDAAVPQKGLSKITASFAAQYADISVETTFSGSFNGISAIVPESRLQSLISDPRVKYIERNQIVRACSTSTFQTMCWGMSYIGADSSSAISNNGTGTVTGVKIYIVDTGIDVNHADLNVAGGINYGITTRDSNNYDDGNGHGTHVAGTAAAKDNGMYTVGVAPGAPVYGVKVLSDYGTGTTSKVIQGIDWIKRHRASNSGPAVANMSISCPASYSLDQAVRGLISSGVTVCVAAGNETTLSSNRSPARTGEAITVGATNSDGTLASFSNYGSGVDVLAPGVGILSSTYTGGVSSKSGTSMSCPHVTGAAALYLSLSGNSSKTPAQVATALVGNAQAWGVSIPTGTTNKMLRVNGY